MSAVALEELKERRQGQAHFLVFLRQSHSGPGRPGTEAALSLSILSADCRCVPVSSPGQL